MNVNKKVHTRLAQSIAGHSAHFFESTIFFYDEISLNDNISRIKRYHPDYFVFLPLWPWQR